MTHIEEIEEKELTGREKLISNKDEPAICPLLKGD